MATPKGTIIIIGGAEEKDDSKEPDMKDRNKDFKNYEVLESLHKSRKGETKIAVIPTASAIPDTLGSIYKNTFDELGYRRTDILDIRSREDTHDKKFFKIIEESSVVFFTGGDQFKLVTILGGSALAELIGRKYYEDKEFVVAGTSAGAAAMAKIMIYEGRQSEAMLMGDVKTMSGLGFFDGCIIDTHFIKRGRFSRLAQAVITNPSCVGIGIGEDTALMIKKGNVMDCFGSGMVTMIDGKSIKFTNINSVSDDTPLCVENLTVHLMCRGNSYLLNERQFLPGKVRDV